MNNSSFPAQNPPGLETRQGQYVKYVMPKGWHVTEDSQFALTLYAPDNAAMIFVGGHFNYPMQEEYLVENYVRDIISWRHPQELQIELRSRSQSIDWNWDYDFTCTRDGVSWRGIARCSPSKGHPGMSALLLTYGAAEISKWANYASWLPQVATQVELTNAAAFGVSEIMQKQLSMYGSDRDNEYNY